MKFKQLLVLAWPLILSNSFTTIQVTIDRIYLSRYSPESLAAATSGLMIFWTPFILLQCTASYVSTFVAQYQGAQKTERIGAILWQAIYFCFLSGCLFLFLLPISGKIVALTGHSSSIQLLEEQYFYCLCWMALPNLLVATVSGFFSGLEKTKVILWMNGVGLVANSVIGLCWIFGYAGFPRAGIEGAGWALVASSWISALVAIGLVFQPSITKAYAIWEQYRFDWNLFFRLIRYGSPAGLQWLIDCLAFTIFLLLAEWFSTEALIATSIAYAINSVFYVPLIGLGQAVSILVGNNLGKNEPEQASCSAILGLRLALVYMAVFAIILIFFPKMFISVFTVDDNPLSLDQLDEIKNILIFVALYSLFDAVATILGFTLRGAGDTLFVSFVACSLAWLVMVVPTYYLWKYNGEFLWAWAFASLYIALQAIFFAIRFRGGKWKSMRVIEPVLN